MGVDIPGKSPVSETGRCYLNNWSGWLPLARYCQMIALEITNKCEHWYFKSMQVTTGTRSASS